VLRYIPVFTPIPDALTRAYINVRDPSRGCLLLVRIGKTIRGHHELVVRSNRCLFVANKNEARQTAFPLRRVVDGCEGGGMYGLRGVVGTRRKALQDWILPVFWFEYGKEEIKLSSEILDSSLPIAVDGLANTVRTRSDSMLIRSLTKTHLPTPLVNGLLIR